MLGRTGSEGEFIVRELAAAGVDTAEDLERVRNLLGA